MCESFVELYLQRGQILNRGAHKWVPVIRRTVLESKIFL